MLGSHLDTVRDAGRYDGPLGVMVAHRGGAARCRGCRSRRDRRASPTRRACASAPPTSARRRVAGRFDPDWPALRDADGIALADLARRRRPGAAAGTRARGALLPRSTSSRGRCSSAAGEPVGVVTAINGPEPRRRRVHRRGRPRRHGADGRAPRRAGAPPPSGCSRSRALAATAGWSRPSDARRARRAQRHPRPRRDDARRPPRRRRRAARAVAGAATPGRGDRHAPRRAARLDATRRPRRRRRRWTSGLRSRRGASPRACRAAPATTPR